MIVYVLMLECDCEPSSVRGVYLTLERVKAEVEAFSAGETTGHLSVYPVEVDAAAVPVGDWVRDLAL